MPWGSFHCAEHLTDEREGYFLVEKIAHAVQEDRPWLLPCKGKVKAIRPQAEVEALLVGMARNAAPAFGEGFSVAMPTARTELRAARHRVPGRISPLYGRLFAHGRFLRIGPIGRTGSIPRVAGTEVIGPPTRLGKAQTRRSGVLSFSHPQIEGASPLRDSPLLPYTRLPSNA